MSTTITQTAAIMTSEVPVATGDVLRAIDTPAVSPLRGSSPPTDEGSQKKSQSPSHRRTSSTASDMARAAGIDIEAVSMAEARKIMSEEHKILGFRPPHGSFAADVQSVASKHPEGKPDTPVDTTKLREIAREDALRILAERKTSPGADRDAPSSSTTASASAAKAAQDGGGGGGGEGKHRDVATPVRHAPQSPGINLNTINATDARILMSHEHRALGFRPPPGSLAAEAQSAAARHPEGDGTRVDDDTLRAVAVRDAERIKVDRELNVVGETSVPTIGKDPAAAVVGEEAKALGCGPPVGQAWSAGGRYPEGGCFAPEKSLVEIAILKEKARDEGAWVREDEARGDGKGSVHGAELMADVLLRRIRASGSGAQPGASLPLLLVEHPAPATFAARGSPCSGPLPLPSPLPLLQLQPPPPSPSADVVRCGLRRPLYPLTLRSLLTASSSGEAGGSSAHSTRVRTHWLFRHAFPSSSRACFARRKEAHTPSDTDPPQLSADGANLYHIVQAISFTILYFDFFLTLPAEVDRYWTGGRSWASFFFFVNRYMSVICHVPVIYEFFWPMPESLYHQLLVAVTQVVVGVLLMLRTYALYNRNRQVIFLLSVICAIGGAVTVVRRCIHTLVNDFLVVSPLVRRLVGRRRRARGPCRLAQRLAVGGVRPPDLPETVSMHARRPLCLRAHSGWEPSQGKL
ncbi:hypothetical protein LXA43DRAFT_890166 [Ganoderma leucocontextum]|nr:hypothetical protein LXA43DRAFT_890166 [Ganoderma leucocontextum]